MLYLKNIYLKHQRVFIYGTSLSALLFILKWLQWKYVISDNSTDIYSGLIAVFFTLLGLWIAKQLSTTKTETIIVEKQIFIPQAEEFTLNVEELKKLNLTPRELEVLNLMAKGKSNNEIAECLFLSLSTIKTHVSNILVKMDVKSRTQALEKAKRLKITP